MLRVSTIFIIFLTVCPDLWSSWKGWKYVSHMGVQSTICPSSPFLVSWNTAANCIWYGFYIRFTLSSRKIFETVKHTYKFDCFKSLRVSHLPQLQYAVRWHVPSVQYIWKLPAKNDSAISGKWEHFSLHHRMSTNPIRLSRIVDFVLSPGISMLLTTMISVACCTVPNYAIFQQCRIPSLKHYCYNSPWQCSCSVVEFHWWTISGGTPYTLQCTLLISQAKCLCSVMKLACLQPNCNLWWSVSKACHLIE